MPRQRSRTTYGSQSKKSPKYRNQKTEFAGLTFDSQKEARRYEALLAMQGANLIRNLELQPRYDLVVNGHKLGYYRPDFRYQVVETGAIITEDVKSPATKTPLYRRKQKACESLVRHRDRRNVKYISNSPGHFMRNIMGPHTK